MRDRLALLTVAMFGMEKLQAAAAAGVAGFGGNPAAPATGAAGGGAVPPKPPQQAAARGAPRSARKCTVIRVKRKRTDEPVETLVVEAEHRSKRSTLDSLSSAMGGMSTNESDGAKPAAEEDSAPSQLVFTRLPESIPLDEVTKQTSTELARQIHGIKAAKRVKRRELQDRGVGMKGVTKGMARQSASEKAKDR